MELAVSIAVGIVLAVVILMLLPQILVVGGVGVLVLAIAAVSILGIIWLFDNPEVIMAVLIIAAIARYQQLFEGWPIKRRLTPKEEERVRRRSLGYNE